MGRGSFSTGCGIYVLHYFHSSQIYWIGFQQTLVGIESLLLSGGNG